MADGRLVLELCEDAPQRVERDTLGLDSTNSMLDTSDQGIEIEGAADLQALARRRERRSRKPTGIRFPSD